MVLNASIYWARVKKNTAHKSVRIIYSIGHTGRQLPNGRYFFRLRHMSPGVSEFLQDHFLLLPGLLHNLFGLDRCFVHGGPDYRLLFIGGTGYGNKSIVDIAVMV